MSELPQQFTIQQYLADGITSVYEYNFLILSSDTTNNDIIVYVQPPGQPTIPSAQVQTLNVDYTVQDVGSITGGTITFQSGHIPTSTSIITIARNMAISIDTEFNQVKNFNGQNLDDSFTRVVLELQQLASLQAYRINNINNPLRAIGYPINSYIPSSSTDQQVPILANGQIWQKVNGAIQAVTLEENPDVSTLRSQLLSEIPFSDGCSIIGYYDAVNDVPQLLSTFLNNLPEYINNIVHPSTSFQSGMMIDFGGSVAPTGWLMCDGALVSRSTYSALFAAITYIQNGQLTASSVLVTGLTDTSQMYIGMPVTGTGVQPGTTVDAINSSTSINLSLQATTTAVQALTFYPWGAGDESTTFAVPNLNGNTTMGANGASTATIGNKIGQTGGETDHTLVVGEVPNLNVTSSFSGSTTANLPVKTTGPTTPGNVLFGTGTSVGPVTISGSCSGTGTGATTNGGGGSHNNIQPSAVVMKIIKI